MMAQSNRVTRRRFLERTAGASAATVLASAGASARTLGANDKINVGLIGAGGQGNWNLGELLKEPDVAVTAVCDVWKDRAEKTAARCKGLAKTYHDFRDVLARKDIDAVLIAPPPHWHALIAIAACDAGKDVYVEKPMTLGVGESLALMRAVRKNKRITQIGTQIHAQPNYRRVVDIVRSGCLGKINVARTFCVMNDGPEGIGKPDPGKAPPGLDWDFWCGPAPLRDFHPLLAKNAHMHSSFMNYSGGWTPGMGPHIVDLPFWALQLGHPSSVSASGGRYIVRDAGDVYDTHEVLWRYPDFTMTWMCSLVNSYGWDLQGKAGTGRRLGIYFQGVNGTLWANYGDHRIIPEGKRMSKMPKVDKVTPDSVGHHREWLDAIRSRKQASCHVGYHYKIDVALQLSLLSLKLDRSIAFDPKTERIVNDPEAAKLALPNYRDPWKIPAEYLV